MLAIRLRESFSGTLSFPDALTALKFPVLSKFTENMDGYWIKHAFFVLLQVKLKDSLVSSLKFAQTRDAELAWVDGQLIIESENRKFQGDEVEEDEFLHGSDAVPVLELLPTEEVCFRMPLIFFQFCSESGFSCFLYLDEQGVHSPRKLRRCGTRLSKI